MLFEQYIDDAGLLSPLEHLGFLPSAIELPFEYPEWNPSQREQWHRENPSYAQRKEILRILRVGVVADRLLDDVLPNRYSR